MFGPRWHWVSRILFFCVHPRGTEGHQCRGNAEDVPPFFCWLCSVFFCPALNAISYTTSEATNRTLLGWALPFSVCVPLGNKAAQFTTLVNNLHSLEGCIWESVEPNKLANVFKQILGTRYLMAPGLWHRTWYGSTSDRMPLCLSVCVCDCVCVCVCAWACMCIQWANVRPGTDRNLATVLCPCVPGELLSQQIKARCSYSLPYSQGHSYRPDHLLSEVYCQRCWWIWIEIMWISSIFLTQKEAWVLNKIRN